MDPVLNISETIKLLSERIETEINRISHDKVTAKSQTDSLVFIGNWQDAIPRSIWVDALLSAVDVRCWGIIRTQAISGSAVMLSLNNLLKESLGYSNATVSRVLFILRLSRWISLCSSCRSKSGKFRGNIYAIHDDPVSLDDAIYLDSQYIEFVKKQTRHSNNAIRTLAQSVWKTITETVNQTHGFQTPALNHGVYGALNHLVNQKASAAERKNHAIHIYNLNSTGNSQVQKLNVATKHPVQFLNLATQKNKSDKNQQHSIQVQNLNVAPICSSRCSSSSLRKKENNNKTPPTNSAGISKQDNKQIQENLIYPKAFNANENQLATLYLQKIEADLQQNFLDETAAIIKQRSKTSNPIRNPIGYLAWLCNEQVKGNTYLTSAYLKHQAQRQRKEAREQSIKQQQQEITAVSLKGGDISGIVVRDTRRQQATKQKSNKTSNRWDGVNQKIKPKQR